MSRTRVWSVGMGADASGRRTGRFLRFGKQPFGLGAGWRSVSNRLDIETILRGMAPRSTCHGNRSRTNDVGRQDAFVERNHNLKDRQTCVADQLLTEQDQEAGIRAEGNWFRLIRHCDGVNWSDLLYPSERTTASITGGHTPLPSSRILSRLVPTVSANLSLRPMARFSSGT